MATAADDRVSLATGMAGQINTLSGVGRYHDASQLAFELEPLLESIGDPTLTVALLWTAPIPKFNVGEITESLRLAQRVIDLADDDPHMGDLIIETPLILMLMMRAAAHATLGRPGWKREMERSAAICREINPGGRPAMEFFYMYSLGLLNGLLRFDSSMLLATAETLGQAEHRGDDYALTGARFLHGVVLAQSDGRQRSEGFQLLAAARDSVWERRFSTGQLGIFDLEMAKEKARSGDRDGAIEILRIVVDDAFATSYIIQLGASVTALVESLLERGTTADIAEAQTAIERLAATPVETGFVMYDVALLRLRALLARARGDDMAYRDFVDRYCTMATSLGFEGHMAAAETMRETR
jgi:adenylate cyclase